jgi:hypothetical protein
VKPFSSATLNIWASCPIEEGLVDRVEEEEREEEGEEETGRRIREKEETES